MAAAMAFLTLDRAARKVANLTAERNALDADLLKVELDAKRWLRPTSSPAARLSHSMSFMTTPTGCRTWARSR